MFSQLPRYITAAMFSPFCHLDQLKNWIKYRKYLLVDWVAEYFKSYSHKWELQGVYCRPARPLCSRGLLSWDWRTDGQPTLAFATGEQHLLPLREGGWEMHDY